jgi:protein-S-isoprenylcysteine O-methyltransferase
MIQWLVRLAYLFMVSEMFLMLTKRTKGQMAKVKRDRGSAIILWLAIAGGITGGFYLAHYKTWSMYNYVLAGIGVLLIIAGETIRWVAITQLKEGFTVDVSISKTHTLKTDGLYGYVRHPSYFGLVLISFGFSLAMNSLLSLLTVIIPVLLALYYRISVEENLLQGAFGEDFTRYKNETRKLIPWIY